MVKKTALVLEGGGLRGAYTAGALSWLIDNNIEFDNAYGISTGAVYLSSFLMKSKDDLKSFSIKHIRNPRVVGLNAMLHSGHIVDYDFLFDKLLPDELNFSMEPLRNIKCLAYIGVYDLSVGKTVYLPLNKMSIKELKASTSLPILGKIIDCDGKQYLDGGITDMIPINQAIADGCNRYIVITTKPATYVRKPAKKVVVSLMKHMYPQCDNISKDYQIRHLNYQKQIELIKQSEIDKKAIYLYPSEDSPVTRLSGSQEDLLKLYELGISDMAKRKDEIFSLIND